LQTVGAPVKSFFDPERCWHSPITTLVPPKGKRRQQ